jgi:hypothetical protein
MLPNYLVIGAPKCGTSTICARLGEHPDVFMSTPKEIHYFGRDEEEKTRAWYEAHFAAAEPASAVGEGSTSYTHPHIVGRCAEEIHAAIPDVRLIFIARHPLTRLESDWKMRMHEGWTDPDINRAVRTEGTTLVGHGRYWANTEPYRAAFDEEQLLVLFLEDLAADPETEIRRCFEHVGVDPDAPVPRAKEARNRSSDFRRDGTVGRWVRSLGLVDTARRLVPRPVFAAAKAALTHSDTYTPTWDGATRRWVWDELRADMSRFLASCGKPDDFWSFD